MNPLFTPFQLGDISLRNRIVLAPLTRARAGTTRTPNALMAEYYTQRASAGLLIAEATAISEQALGWVDSPGIYRPEHIEGWKLVTKAAHENGAPIFLQLWHCGRASHSSFRADRSPPVSASAIKIQGEDIHTPEGKQPHETPRALDAAELPAVVADYQTAARNAIDAGFDGVEVHAANGYLLDQFLQSKTNHRTDAYGGSIENRFRLLRGVLEAILSELPANRVGVRLSPNGAFNDMGSPDYREQFLYVAEQLADRGLAYLHVVDGLAFGFHNLGEPVTLREVRAVYPGTILGNCGYTKDSAEAAISAGDADLIAFGRPFISNPDLVERFRNGWSLAPDAPVTAWSAPGPEGYTDFPTYAASGK